MQIQSREEFIKFLETLGFKKSDEGDYFSKFYSNINYEIKIEINNNDFKKSLIYYNPNRETISETTPYPNGQINIGDLTTSNFENPENFVVLECVDRLLTLGYRPENIHLERKWRLGRTSKSGKADITVYFPPDNSGQRKTFMIIECKTFGYEFEKEKKRLYKDGGQLFSYFQQDKSTNLLVLYTSIFENNKIEYDAVIIKTNEEEESSKELIKRCKEEREKENKDYPCSLKEANDVSQLVDVWKRVYKQFVFKHGIFERDCVLYNPDLQPLKKKDLIDLSSSQGLFNSFAEILRHNNISDNANAFNKMMSLFLCKIVDEETKSDEDVLDFQVKFGESYEALVDRLQHLYKIGMEKYLGIKDFVYYSDEDIRRIIDLYPKRTKIEEIEEIFKQIKYYTNNEFAFKEVHNKTLFYQNALILTEMIELIQRYRFKYSHKQQILGNFFELLLNHGVKQSQGQFFTPMPIVRFIVISIGIDRFIEKRLEKLHENDKESAIPKVIDYACGVAHFLTECIDEINKIIKKHDIKVRMPWEEKFIFGIEKDYRLARTAKIACFLNGDGSANILHGDGLDDHEILKLDEKKFDILLTNPPYSIANFKRYLDVKPQYELLDYLTENSSEIEVLFIERAKQIVEEKGRVAIVLPASILTNSNVYKKARELILKYFEIKAIAEFGSKTFIATGTNTVVMFLERRGDWFFEDRRRIADEIFIEKKIKTNDYVDIEKLFNFFIDYRKLPKDEYKSFVLENVITDALRNHKTFKQYEEAFKSSPDFKNIEKNRNLSDEEKQEKAEETFKDWIREIEKEKFLYFSLMFKYGDKYEDKSWYELQKIVIARSPSDTESQKKYLGYEFSKRRGYEGIQILKDENGNPISKLYDDNDYDNKTKVAYYIRESFENNLENIEVDDKVEEFVKIYNLPDLFDFERKDFGKEINLDMPEKSVNYKFPMMRLGDSNLTLLIDSGQNAPQESKYFADGSIPFVRAKDLNYVSTNGYIQINNCDRINQIAVDDLKLKIYEENSIVFPKSGQSINTDNIGILPEKSAVVNHLAIIRTNEEKLHFKYLYYLLKYIIKPSSLKSGKGDYPSINIDTIKNIHIPLPPIEIQKQIVQKIEKLECKCLFNQQKVKKLMNKMWNIIDEVIKDSTLQRIKLERVLLKKNCSVKVPRNKWLIQGDIPVVSQESEKLISGYVMKYSYKPFTELPVLIFGDHTCAIKYVDFPFVCGADGVVVLKLDSNIIIPKFAYFLLKKLILNLPNIGKYERHFKYLRDIEIPIPPMKIQKQIVQEIEELEGRIDELEKKNEILEKEKINILTKHLF